MPSPRRRWTARLAPTQGMVFHPRPGHEWKCLGIVECSRLNNCMFTLEQPQVQEAVSIV